MQDYILITPAHNEEDSLPLLIQSIVNQTVRPSIWVIVDDQSSDSTKDIIFNAIQENNWIEYISTSNDDISIKNYLRYASVCNIGFKKAFDIAEKNDISFQYIGLSDSDNTIDEIFFEFLMNQLINNPRLGIVSGMPLFSQSHITSEDSSSRENYLPGGVRLWSISCFNETGGYYPTPAPDTVSNALALARGYKIKTFSEVRYYPTRNNLAQVSTLLQYKKKGGFADFHIGRPIDFALIKTMYNGLLIWPFVHSLWYLLGYCTPIFKRIPRIDNEEVITIFRDYSLSLNGDKNG